MTLPIFPTLAGRTWPIARRPSFNTTMQAGLTGKRTPVRYQSEPRWSYEFDIELMRDATTELNDMLNVFLLQYGRYGTFLYNEAVDNSVTDDLIGTGDGATNTFFLTRSRYGFVQRIAGAALDGAATIKVNGVTAVGVTVSSNGVVTFGVAPSAGQPVTWTGSYYWVCRFDDDALDLENFMSGKWAVKSLKFSTEIITG
jgi:uncharacterized protein (TIGR02217 family)